jgi:hypothetical protein
MKTLDVLFFQNTPTVIETMLSSPLYYDSMNLAPLPPLTSLTEVTNAATLGHKTFKQTTQLTQ